MSKLIPHFASGQATGCPNCKGKGHVFDSAAIILLLVPVIGWMMLLMTFFEFNNSNGLTRESCPHCGGKGFVKEP